MPTRTEDVGDKRVTASYGVDTSGMGYSIITPDIAADFNFLIQELPNKLDEVSNYINEAAGVSDAFYFEGSGTYQDISEAAQKLNTDINALKGTLAELHSAFMTDIDQINAELEYNYGWVTICDPKGSYKIDKKAEE
jgi:hypothetical protein